MFNLAYARAGKSDLGQHAVIGRAWVKKRVIERCGRP
jgi:hypothetical protein